MEKKPFGIVYKATNTVNGKVYIGITTQKFEARISHHKYKALTLKKKCKFYSAIRKYGWESFTWEIIDEADSLDDLFEKERYWIEHFDSQDNGYNMSLGGEGNFGYVPSEETRRKISEANAKLTVEDIIEIKKLLVAGVDLNDIASQFDVSPSTIKKNVFDKHWEHANIPGWEEYLDNLTDPRKKITEEDALEVKKLLMNGTTYKEIASKFGVSTGLIRDIRIGISWKHIKPPGWDEYVNKKSNRKKKYASDTSRKLTEEDVVEIKKMLVEGHKQKDIASKFNVKPITVAHIAAEILWKDITVPGWGEYQANRKRRKKRSA